MRVHEQLDGQEWVIRLSPQEVIGAGMHAVWRRGYAMMNGFEHRTGRNTDWHEQVASSAAEMAVAKATGQYWTGQIGVGMADVGEATEVRWTRAQSPCLQLRPHDVRDKLDRVHVLTTGGAAGTEGVFILLGWAFGRDAMGEGVEHEGQWWTERYGGQWSMPADALHRMCDWPEDVGDAIRDRRIDRPHVSPYVPRREDVNEPPLF